MSPRGERRKERVGCGKRMKSVDRLVCVCLAWPTSGCGWEEGCRKDSLGRRTGTEKPSIVYSERIESDVGQRGTGRDQMGDEWEPVLEDVRIRQSDWDQDETSEANVAAEQICSRKSEIKRFESSREAVFETGRGFSDIFLGAGSSDVSKARRRQDASDELDCANGVN